MHQTAEKIISVLGGKGSELSTSQILEEIDDNYKSLINLEDELSKRKKSKIHRRILHHLNSLVKSGLVTTTRHGDRGEKIFTLNLLENEEIILGSLDYKKRKIVSKNQTPSIPIEGYERNGVLLKYEPATWINRATSIIVFSERFNNLNDLYRVLVNNVFPTVNDTISLENFEEHIESETQEFLKKLSQSAQDYGKNISITLDFSRLKSKDKTLLLNSLENLENINIILSIDKYSIEDSDLFLDIINSILETERELFIKNKTRFSAPYFIGKAGPYSVDEKEWALSEDLRNKTVCLACSQSTIIVDVNRFFNEHGFDIRKFSDLMLKISKSILSANSLQRRKSNECFGILNQINQLYAIDFLSLARNYIRFWNYGLDQKDIDYDLVLTIINEAKKKVHEFTSAEETIYKSCGMTARFKIALSQGFVTADQLSPAKYERLEISNESDLHKKEIKQRIKQREEVGQVFNGGSKVTFHYTGEPDPRKISEQILTILEDYKIPFFNYKFSKMKGDQKLNKFF